MSGGIIVLMVMIVTVVARSIYLRYSYGLDYGWRCICCRVNSRKMFVFVSGCGSCWYRVVLVVWYDVVWWLWYGYYCVD